MQTVDPLEARQWFVWKGPINWVISIAVFIPFYFLLMQVLGGFIAFLIVFPVVGCLFFFYLDTRAIGIKCPHCQQYIETETPWICGNKDTPHRNDLVYKFPFIGHCQYCGFVPKAYQCHHCLKLIFLSEDKLVTAYARCADIPVTGPRPVKKDPTAGKIAELDKGIQVTERMVKKAELDVKLKGFKDVLEPPKIKTVGERLRSKLHSKTELDDEVRRLKQEADKEFAGDEAGRARRYLEIDAEARELL